MTSKYLEKDKEVQDKIKRMQIDLFEMETLKTKFENERIKILEEMHRTQEKLEEEIRTRLFFETKLNSLHCLNMEEVSKT